MRNTKLLFVGIILIVLVAGCGSNGSPSLPSSRIDATTNIAGMTQAWTNASVSGQAFQYGCSLGTDVHCQPSFGNDYTDSQGHFVLSTDAIPGTWGIAGAADSECATGASFYGQVSASIDTPLTCGQIDPTFPAVSPSSCSKTTWVNLDTRIRTTVNNCPATVTLTTSSPEYPTGRALSVIGYNDAGTQVSSASVNATSSTSITMPTPTQTGYSVLVIRDPSNNAVLGSSLFDFVVDTKNCYTNGTPTCPN